MPHTLRPAEDAGSAASSSLCSGSGSENLAGRESTCSGAEEALDCRRRRFSASSLEPPSTESVKASAAPPRSWCCAACGGLRGGLADPEELRAVLRNLRGRELVLAQEVVVGGELFERGAVLARVGSRRRGRGWDNAAVREQLEAAASKGQSLWLAFRVRGAGLPWCLLLRCPCCVFASVVAGVLAFACMSLISGVTLNTDFDSFMDSDGDASLRWKAAMGAMADRSKQRQSRRLGAARKGRHRRLAARSLYQSFHFHVTYARTDGGNLLNMGSLGQINSIEKLIRAMPAYRALCKDAMSTLAHLCRQGISAANLVFPVAKEVDGQDHLYFNGSGSSTAPLSVAMGLARQDSVTSFILPQKLASAADLAFDDAPACSDLVGECARWSKQGECLQSAEHEVYMRDFCAQTCGYCSVGVAGGEQVSALRSHFILHTYCCTTDDPGMRHKLGLQKERWSTVVKELVQTLSPLSGQGGLQVYYSGRDIEGYEVMKAVAGDAQWAMASFVFVMFYATLHTRSLLLALLGLFLVMLSIPTGLAVFCIMSSSQETSLMMGLSVFIIIGVGSDMLFVYTDFWKQSLAHSRDPAERLRFTYSQAASSTMATTFTTAMSFLANLASALRPLREFGFFMGCCVTAAWLLVFLAYPPLLIVSERCHRRARSCLLPRAVAPPGRRRSTVGAVARTSTVAMAVMLDPEKKGVGELEATLLGRRLAVVVYKCRFVVIIIFAGLTAGSLWSAVVNVEQEADIPQLLPDNHNQVAGKAYESLFRPFQRKDVPSAATFAGRFARRCTDLFEDCEIHSCQTTGWRLGSAERCQCLLHENRTGSFGGTCSHYSVDLRLAGRQGLEPESVRREELEAALRRQFTQVESVTVVSEPEPGSQLETLHWESGREALGVLLAARASVALQASGGFSASCALRELCYCGVEPCRVSARSAVLGELALDAPARAQRRLQGTAAPAPPVRPEVRPELRADVIILFGLEVTGKNPLLGVAAEQPWGYLGSFRLEDPWAQRKIISLCAEFPPELEVASSYCWLAGFKEWWRKKGHDWPVREERHDFHSQAYWYVNNKFTNGRMTTHFVWIGADHKIKAMYIQAMLMVSKFVGSGYALELMDKWEKHVSAFDAQAPASVKGAWQASKLWVRAEAEKVVLDSTLVTLCISLGCVLLGVVLFTRSLHLALIVMLNVMCIVICLLFFMVVLMGWKIGAIEVLSLIVFVGFAVDYCLHVAHKYHSCHIAGVEEEEEEEEKEEEQREEERGEERQEQRAKAASGPGTSQQEPEVGTRPESEEPQPHVMASEASEERCAKSSSTEVWARAAPAERSMRRTLRTGGTRARLTVTISDEPRQRKVAAPRGWSKLLKRNRGLERFERTKYALERMGGSVVGSALTTVGCAAFLLPCTLQVFAKIGAVVCGVTLYAVLYTLLPLPAILMVLGPCGHDFKSCKQIASRVAQQLAPGPVSVGEAAEVEAAGEADGAGGQSQRASHQHRYYVLNLPSRGMGQCEPGGPPCRTLVTVSG